MMFCSPLLITTTTTALLLWTVLATTGKATIILDHDGDVDDFGALMYLLAKNGTNVKAITAEATGWSNQWSGVTNTMRVLQQFQGCGAPGVIDVAYGRKEGYTVLANASVGYSGSHYYNDPKQAYMDGIDTMFTDGCAGGYQWNVVPQNPYPLGSKNLLLNTIRSETATTGEKIDILMTGPYTNIAEAIMEDPRILEEIGTIYISGAGIRYDLNIENLTSDMTESNATLGPGGESGGWNAFLDANAANFVLGAIGRCQRDLANPASKQIAGYWYPKSCPQVQIMGSTAQHQLNMTTPVENELECRDGCATTELGQMIQAYYDDMPECLDESRSSLFYWDQSAAVMAAPGLADEFCTSWTTANLSVSLLAGPLFSSFLVDDVTGTEVTVCDTVDRRAFLDVYWEPFRQIQDGKMYCTNNESVAGAPLAMMNMETEPDERQQQRQRRRRHLRQSMQQST